MGGGAMLGGPPLPKHGVRGGLGLVRRAALVCAMLLVGAGEAAHVTWEEPELEILEPVDGSVVRLLEGDSAVLRFGVNFLKGQCEDFSIRLSLNALVAQDLSPCACESLEFYCLLTLSLLNYDLSGPVDARAEIVDLRSGQVVSNVVKTSFDLQLQSKATSSCQCHTQECSCRFSYQHLYAQSLECDAAMNCHLMPLVSS